MAYVSSIIKYQHSKQRIYFFFFAEGLSKTFFMPAAWCTWNFRFCCVSWDQAASIWVVSWSTRWVYLVRPDRPKFLTCITLGNTVLSNLSSKVAEVTSLKKDYKFINILEIYRTWSLVSQKIAKFRIALIYRHNLEIKPYLNSILYWVNCKLVKKHYLNKYNTLKGIQETNSVA